MPRCRPQPLVRRSPTWASLSAPRPLTIAIAYLEWLAGELASVNDCVRIHRSKTPLEIDDARRPVVEQDPREVGEDVVRGRVDDQDRFHLGSVPTAGQRWADRGLPRYCGEVAVLVARARRKVSAAALWRVCDVGARLGRFQEVATAVARAVVAEGGFEPPTKGL